MTVHTRPGTVGYLPSWEPRRALRPVTQIVASSAEGAMRSSEAKSSPWMMEKMQSRDELLDPVLLPPAAPEEDEPEELAADEDEEPAAAATTAAAAATPAPDVPDEAMTPWPRTSVVWTLRTSRMLEIKTGKEPQRTKQRPDVSPL